VAEQCEGNTRTYQLARLSSLQYAGFAATPLLGSWLFTAGYKLRSPPTACVNHYFAYALPSIVMTGASIVSLFLLFFYFKDFPEKKKDVETDILTSTINKDISETANKDSTTLEANLYDIVPTIEDDLVDLEHDHRASHEYKKNRRIDEETEKKVIIQKEFFKVYWLLAWLNFTSRGVLRVFEVMSPHALLTTYNLSEIQTGLVVTIAI